MRRAERGFTLLEMIVATTIMAIAVVGLLSGISGATRNAARLRDYDRVVQLARLRMNELLVDQRLPRDTVLAGAFDPAQTGGLEAGWQARLTTFEMPPAGVARPDGAGPHRTGSLVDERRPEAHVHAGRLPAAGLEGRGHGSAGAAMRRAAMKRQAGVTLIEVLIAVTLLSLLTMAMLFAMRVGLTASPRPTPS